MKFGNIILMKKNGIYQRYGHRQYTLAVCFSTFSLFYKIHISIIKKIKLKKFEQAFLSFTYESLDVFIFV